jgi:hypothetical protein
MFLKTFQKKTAKELVKYHILQASKNGVTLEELKMIAQPGSNEPTKWLNERYLELFAPLSIDDIDVDKLHELENEPLLEDGISMPLMKYKTEEVRDIRTYAEYRQAVADGFEAMGTPGIKAATGVFEPFGAILALVKAARVPRESYIDQPRVGVTSIDQIPVSILESGYDNDGGSLSPADKTIGELVLQGEAKIGGVGSDYVDIEYRDFSNRIMEVMRADLDGDGFEELLVSVNVISLGGTMGYTRMVILGKRSASERFQAVVYDPLGNVRPSAGMKP